MNKTHRSFSLLPAIVLLIAGCSSATKGAAAPRTAPGQRAGGANYVSAAPLSTQLTTATITDPSLNNMVAATITIPAGWKLQGIEMKPPCTPAPFPAFRAYSPDGLMQLRAEPMLG